MILFTKDDCSKCSFLRKHVDLEAHGVTVSVLGPENAEALADLAWYGLVAIAEKSLPILVLGDGRYLTGAIPIMRYLQQEGPRFLSEGSCP